MNLANALGDSDLPEAAGKGLFLDMRVDQYAGAQNGALGQFHAPAIGVILPAGIAMRDGHVKLPARAGGPRRGTDNLCRIGQGGAGQGNQGRGNGAKDLHDLHHPPAGPICHLTPA